MSLLAETEGRVMSATKYFFTIILQFFFFLYNLTKGY